MRVNEKMKKLLSILLCLCMLLQNAPVMAFAATTDNLCEHHTEHTAECGYREGSAGSACAHEHSEDCYAILECLHTCGEECADGCTHECTVENGCITMELDCHHVHGGCGYSEGTAEVPCGHVHNENCGYVEAVAGNPCANAETDPECDHSGDCGFVAAVEGQPCGHTACDDTCGYAPATEGTPCTHVCEVKVNSDDSCYKLLCSHKDGGHDDACGYAEAVEAHECHYECAECAAAAASEEAPEESSEPAPVCTCGTDDPAIHATTCGVYVAPENPVCYCAEKCTEVNEWCDVCGFDYTQCGGTDTAVGYAEGTIDLSQYSEGATIDISEDCKIIGDGNAYNISLNIAEDATVIFDVGASGVKLGGQITVADGKTLTLLVAGDAEHTVNGGISLGNGSNVIIEGDLTKENNKLTVTATGGNAGIGANNGVTAGDITIRNARVDATGSGSSDGSGAAIGTSDASMGNILIDNSIVIAAGGYYNSDDFMEISHAAAIGMGYYGGTIGNITLKNSEITASNNGDGLASVIGAGSQNKEGDNNAGTLGDIIITNTDLNLSMVISNKNTHAAIIGPGMGYSYAWTNMGKIIFTDVTQTELDEMIANWLPSDFNEWGAYALGRGYDGSAYKKETFGGVWVSDGNGGIVQIGDESGYYIACKNGGFVHDFDEICGGTCSDCGVTYYVVHTMGTAATCIAQAVCSVCGESYGELGGHTAEPTYAPNAEDSTKHDVTYSCCGATVTEAHTLDVTTGKCSACGADMTAIATVTDGTNTYYATDAATLNQAVTAILETGSRTFTVELPADAEAGMITAIRRAICDTEGVADGSIHLTLKGVTTIPGTTNWDGVAFGPRNAQWDENNVEIVSHEEVTQLASVNLPDVTEIGAQAFLDCSNLTSITAPKVQFIGDWGLQGTAITSIDMPLLKEAGYSAFCRTALTEVSLPSLETAGVIVFGHCEQLRTVDLPKLQNLSQQLFTRCTSLVSVSAPAATSMGINVFKGCSELVSITLPGVTELTNEAFAECTKLENITLGSVITKVNVNLFAGEALSSGITLTLNCGQKNAETLPAAAGTNVEWAGFTWNEVKFAHSYVNSKCTVCGEDCAHTGGTATCTTLAVCESCGASYGAVDITNHDSSVECENGFCPNGCYEPATLNAEGYYEIDNAGKLFWFAQQVNVKGNREIKGVLTAHIDLENKPWTPIGETGENNNNFRGVFDGQGHTIKGLNVEGSENGVGFFGEVRTGTVKNFTIYGNVVVNTEVDYVGGVIGSICGLNSTDHGLERNGAIIQNITSFVNVTAKAHGIGMIGGFVGYANHQSLIEQCAWYGTFDAGEYRVDSGAGGFIGKIQENTSEVTIRNCGAYGTIKTNYAGDYNNTPTIYMGGFLSFSNTDAKTTLENCLFAGRFERGENLTDQAFLGAFGTLRSVNAIKNCYYLGDDGLAAVHSDSNLKPGSDNVEITKVTGEALRSNTIATQLGDHWMQDVHYPIPKDTKAHSDSATYTYTDNGDGTHKATCTECGYEETSRPHTIENHVCTDCGAMEIVVSFNAGDFEWKTGDKLYFCRVSGDNEWEEYTFTATVAGDGTVTWTPDRTLYWDGTGEHKLVVIYPDTGYVWDRWYIDEDQSTLENLRKNDHLNSIWSGNPTTNPITFNLKHRLAKVTVNYEVAEGVTISKAEVYTLTQYLLFDIHTLERKNVAWEEGHDLWINSYLNDGQFTAFVSPDAYAADGNFIKITLSDGSVREVKMNKAVTFEEGAEYTYKVVITADGAYLTCADECTFEYTDNEDGLTHSKTCSKCGYVAASEAHSGGTATCTEQAECQHCGASYGEVDKNNHDETVAYVNGFCPNCDAFEPATDSDSNNYYEIDNAGKLYWFAAQVNSGKTNINGELKANIVINEDVLAEMIRINPDPSRFRLWTPIGTEDNAYIGDFCGLEHTVSGLYFNDSNAGYVGLFGYVGSGMVNHVGVIDSYFNGSGAVGGVVGHNEGTVEYAYSNSYVGGNVCIGGVVGDNRGTVMYAYNLGSISGLSEVGGVVGANDNTVKNCYNVVSISGDSLFGDVVGDNFGTLENCYYPADAETDELDGTTAKTWAQFKSGEVAYLLGRPFGQNIGTNSVPVLYGETVYYGYTSCGDTVAKYTNDETISAEKPDHTQQPTYTDNRNGTHSAAYPCCGTTVTEDHTLIYTAKDNVITAACSANCGYSETATITAENATYNGTAQETATVAYNGWTGGELTVTYANNVNAGTATASITIGEVTASVDFTIAKATVTVTADAKSKPYGTDNPTLTYTSEGLLGDDALTGALETTATKTSNVGEYDITVGSLANSNYTIDFVGAKLTITKAAAPEIQWPTAAALTYGQKLSDSALTSEDKNGTFAWQDGSIVPTVKNNGYVVVYTPKDTDNYDYTVVELTETIPVTVSKVSATVTAAPTPNTLTYTGEGQYLISAGEAVGGEMQYSTDNQTWSTTIPQGTDAGKYTVYYKVIGDENHSDTAVDSIEVTIAKADPVIGTVGCEMALFDSIAASAVELKRTDMTVDGTLILTDAKLTAGEGTYNWKFTPEDTDNYNTITGTVVLTVTADVLEQIRATGTLEKFSYVYGEPFSIDGMTITASYTSGTTKDVTGLVSFDSTLAVGQTAVELTYQGKICVIDGITVARKQLDVSGMAWDVPENAVYSGTAYTATLTGELPEGVTVTKTGNTATNAGNYTAKAVFSLAEGYSADNYEIVNGEDLTAEWSIDKAALTITADSYESVRYGSAAPAFAANYSGFVNGETEAVLGGELVFSCEYDTANAAKRKPGDYPIVPSGLTSNNYEISYVDGNLEVISANLVIVIDDKTVTYGDAAPEYTYHYEGFVYGEDISVMDEPGTVSCAYVPGNAVGTMEIKSDNYGSDDCYFVVNQRIGTLTVEKAPLTITAEDNSITYGDAPAANGVTGTGFVNGESFDDLSGELTYSYNYEQFGNVGTYKITPVGLTSDNYEITFADGTLTVNAKAITVTADAVSKTYGDTDPTLTYTAQGLVNGDELTGELKRAAGENIGSYAIEQNTLTAGDNYTITYTGANLTINAKAITEADVELNGSLTYTGKELTQPITVTEGITYEVTGNKATNVGTYELTVKGIGNYTGEVKLNWSIKEAAAVVGKAPTAKELTYTGTAQALVNAGTTADGKLVYSLSENGEFTESIPTGTNAGEYTVWYYVQGDDNHSDTAKASVKVTIAKADPVIGTVGCEMDLYDSTAVSNVVLTRTDMSVEGTLVLTDSELTAGEGTYNWKFTPKDTNNYNTITGTVVLNVTADVLEKIEASGTLEKDSYSYGDTFSIDGLTVTATYTTGATKDVTELVSFDSTLAVGQTSVELTYQGKTCTVTGFTVAKKQLVVSGMAWDIPENAVYSGTAYSATLTGVLPEGVTVTKTGDTATNAGDYTAKAVFSLAEGYSADNYEIVNGEDLTADWTIAKKNIVGAQITLGTALTYNGKQQTQAVASVKIDGLTVTYTVSGNTGTDVKDYTLTITGNGNFEGTETKEWSIAKKNISGATITLGDSLTYIGNEQTQEVADVKIGDLTVTYDVTANKQTNAGNYTLTVTGNGNFEGSVTADWSIAKAKLTITANNNSITYGDVPAASGVTGTGFVSSESIENLSGELTYSYNYEQFGNVGTYKITPSGVTSNNYEITFADGTLTVNAKAITVTADALSKTYGEADPALTYKVEGLVNGDELTGELKRVSGENVGSYAIEQNTLTAGNNYRLTYTGAKLTINAKTIIAADVNLNGSLTYNGREQTQPITVTEGITYEVSGNKATNAGAYELIVEGTGNYTGSVTLDWTIAKAKLTITADSKVIYIGEKVPTLSYTASGLVGGDKLTKEPVLTTNADADQAGSYTITAANADAGDNYTITYVSGSLTIMDKETEVETKIEQTELTEVPEGLKDTQFDTVEEIKEELISKILTTSTGYSAENMVHYDVALHFSLDGGDSWILATEENFPTEGITVILPYPEGTNARDYEFVVSHMFTVTSQRLETVAGEVEMPKVEETANGIRVTLNGLSPVTVAARYHDHTGGTATCSDKAICSICGTAYGELDATNHAGGTEVKNAKEATCGAEGYTGDTHCKGCGEIVEKGAAIKATGEHTYGDWKVVKEPTKTAKGEKQRTCSVCGHVDSKEIPVLSDTPATGDDSNIMLYSSMFTVSLAGLVVLLLAAKKRKQENA